MAITAADISRLRVIHRVTIYIDNGLNQTASVQIKGNRTNSTSKALNIGSAISVAATSQARQTLTVGDWLPWLYISVSCATGPTSDSLTIYLLKDVNVEEKMIDDLAIRDTTTHDPDTDPTKIFFRKW